MSNYILFIIDKNLVYGYVLLKSTEILFNALNYNAK